MGSDRIDIATNRGPEARDCRNINAIASHTVSGLWYDNVPLECPFGYISSKKNYKKVIKCQFITFLYKLSICLTLIHRSSK